MAMNKLNKSLLIQPEQDQGGQGFMHEGAVQSSRKSQTKKSAKVYNSIVKFTASVKPIFFRIARVSKVMVIIKLHKPELVKSLCMQNVISQQERFQLKSQLRYNIHYFHLMHS